MQRGCIIKLWPMPDIWKDKGREALWNSNAKDEGLYIYVYIMYIHWYMWAFVAFSGWLSLVKFTFHNVIICRPCNFDLEFPEELYSDSFTERRVVKSTLSIYVRVIRFTCNSNS